MNRKYNIILGLCVSLALVGNAQADYYVTGTASIYNLVPPPTDYTDVVRSVGTSGGSSSFTIDVTATNAGRSTAALGDVIYAVSGDYITSYATQTGGHNNPSFGSDATTGVTYNMVGISALSGTISSVDASGNPTATFTHGQAAFFLDKSSFSVFDPSTWGATDSTGKTYLSPYSAPGATGSNLYSLVNPPVQTFQGAPGTAADNFSPNQLNSASANFGGTKTSGQFEFSTINNGGFIKTNPVPGQLGDGLIVNINEQIVSSGTSAYNVFSGSSGQSALNTIFQNLEGQNIAGGFTGYDPTGGNNPNTIQYFGFNADPANTLTPAPSSALLLGLGAFGVAGYSWLTRRNRKKMATA